MLTENAAKEMGQGLRFLRHIRNLVLHDIARRAGMSLPYASNIELGDRLNVSEEAYEKLARGYEIPPVVVHDLLLKARVSSALEKRGLTAEQRTFVWRGVEQRCAEAGVEVRTDLAELGALVLASPWTQRPPMPRRRSAPVDHATEDAAPVGRGAG